MNLFDKSPRFVKIYCALDSLKKSIIRFVCSRWWDKKSDIKDNTGHLFSFIRNSITSIFAAVITAWITWFIEPCFVQCAEDAKSFTAYYVAVLIAVAAIETLFIGLYYAGMTSVASATYAKVPYEIRELLIKDRVSNLFMRMASISSVYVYIMLGICLLFDVYSKIAYALSIISVILIIPSFLFLGKRLFNLFNPRNWVPFLSNQLNLQWKILGKLNHYYALEDNATFCQKKGMGIARCLECLSQILNKNAEYSKRDLFRFDCDIIGILQRYQVCKRSFPTNSLWYGKKYRYKNITEQDYVQINYMLGFQNQMPIEGTDDYWFENCLEKLLFNDIKHYAADAEFTAIIPKFGKYIQSLAYNNEYGRALLIIDKLWGLKPASFSQEHWGVSFVENIFIFEINLIVYLSETLDKRALSAVLQKIKIEKKESLYKTGFNPSQLRALEGLNEKIQTEMKIEGSVKTPPWYIVDFLCQREAIRFNDNYKLLTKQNIERFENRLKDAQLSPICKAATLKCIEEFWARVFKLENRIMSIYNSLSTDVKDPLISFTNLIKNEYKKEYEDHLKYLTVESSIIIPAISLKARNEEIPDYGGILFLKMFSDCIDFVMRGDLCIVEKCFQSGLTSVFMRVIYAKNIDEMKEYVDYAILISNVLLICSEYYENEHLVSLIDSAWDKQMDFCFNDETLKTLFTRGRNFFFSDIDDTKMGMNSQVAIEFERKIITLIEKVPYEMKDSRKSMILKQNAVVNHKSALIRHLVKNYREHPSYMRKIDIKHPFFVHYFMKNPYLQDCEFGWENEYLKRALEGGDDEEK